MKRPSRRAARIRPPAATHHERRDRNARHGSRSRCVYRMAEDGTFARGHGSHRVRGGFYGSGHARAAGIFVQSNVVGAFGTKRQ